MDLTKLAREIHQQNMDAGWWDDWPRKRDRFRTARVLIASEICEALEGARKDLMDDHLWHRKMFDVELADGKIRSLDLLCALDMSTEFDETTINRNLIRHEQLANDLERLDLVLECLYRNGVRDGLCHIIALARFKGINLLEIVAEKRAYNANRDDHKRENRAKDGGKKF